MNFLLGGLFDVGHGPSVDRDFTRVAADIWRALTQIFAKMTAGRKTVTRLLDKVAHMRPIVGSFCLLLDFPYLLRCLILVTIRQCKQEIYAASQIKECHATRI